MSKSLPAEEFARRQAKVAPVAALLAERHGQPEWRSGVDPMDELVSCILSQSTTDSNRDRGFAALKARWPDWQGVVDAPTEEVIATIRVAGLANQKGPRIQGLLRAIHEYRGAWNIDFLADLPLEEATAWLTSLRGVGPKTAAIVLCFAFGRPRAAGGYARASRRQAPRPHPGKDERGSCPPLDGRPRAGGATLQLPHPADPARPRALPRPPPRLRPLPAHRLLRLVPA